VHQCVFNCLQPDQLHSTDASHTALASRRECILSPVVVSSKSLRLITDNYLSAGFLLVSHSVYTSQITPAPILRFSTSDWGSGALSAIVGIEPWLCSGARYLPDAPSRMHHRTSGSIHLIERLMGRDERRPAESHTAHHPTTPRSWPRYVVLLNALTCPWPSSWFARPQVSHWPVERWLCHLNKGARLVLTIAVEGAQVPVNLQPCRGMSGTAIACCSTTVPAAEGRFRPCGHLSCHRWRFDPRAGLSCLGY
jgi:hypothetical protein